MLMSKVFASIIVMTLIFSVQGCIGGEQDSLVRQWVWNLATRSPDPRSPDTVSQLTKLLEDQGVNKAFVEPILVEYGEGRNLPKEFGGEVSAFATQVLVDWRSRKILPVLIQRATTNLNNASETEKNERRGALAMVMRIGGEKALNVATMVLTDSQKYDAQERFCVYENLAQHLLGTNAPEEDKTFRIGVVKLMDPRIENEKDVASVEVMDMALSIQLEEYRKSRRRENILKKHEKTEMPLQQKYIRDALNQIRGTRTGK